MLVNDMLKLNWRLLWQKSSPKKFDLVLSAIICFAATMFVIIVAIADSSSASLVKQTVGSVLNDKMSSILMWLDGFEFTNSIVTFMFWGFIGLVSYTGVNMVLAMSREVSYEHELTSDDYVRPSRKTKRDIVMAEFASAAILGLTALMLLLVAAAVAFVILPALIINVRAATLDLSFENILAAFTAILLLVAGIGALLVGGRLLIHRQLLLNE